MTVSDFVADFTMYLYGYTLDPEEEIIKERIESFENLTIDDVYDILNRFVNKEKLSEDEKYLATSRIGQNYILCMLGMGDSKETCSETDCDDCQFSQYGHSECLTNFAKYLLDIICSKRRSDINILL